MTDKEEIGLSPEQELLLAKVLSSIQRGKRFSQDEFEEYIYLLRDLSIATALEKRLKGKRAFMAELHAADRLNDIVLKYEAGRGPADPKDVEENVISVDLTLEEWSDDTDDTDDK